MEKYFLKCFQISKFKEKNVENFQIFHSRAEKFLIEILVFE